MPFPRTCGCFSIAEVSVGSLPFSIGPKLPNYRRGQAIPMSKRLGTIAVDLTPLLPGGDNGGAKIFVIELMRGLARVAPGIQFVLLTQFGSHEELSTLDRPNMRRLLVISSPPKDR